MDDTSLTFSFYLPVAHDVVFNEIMADPDPEVGLPPVEYLELYNNSAYDISLSGWSLEVGSSVKNLGNVNIPANDYLIITNSIGADTLDYYGQVVAMLGSTDLTNAGNTLVLRNELGDTIDILTYSVIR